MRKTIIFLSLALMLGCSKDEQDCRCDVKIAIIDGSEGVTGSYTILNAPSDCSDGFDWVKYRSENNLPSNHWFQGVENCD